MKTITIKRSPEEIEADAESAESVRMTVHAWRRAVLNAANGSAAKLMGQLKKVERPGRVKKKDVY